MSNRHRSQDFAPAPRMELRAHAHNERHRVHSELSHVAEVVSSGIEPDDVIDPGPAWKPVHHHDPEKALKKSSGVLKHWKTKEWKRRKNVRKAKAQAWNNLRNA